MNKILMNINLNKKEKHKKGFATLMLVIIISGIISAVIFPVFFESYLVESNIRDRQLKEESKFSARSCIQVIILQISEFTEFTENTFKSSGVPDCKIHSMQTLGDQRTILVESKIEKFHTLLRATINSISEEIISLEEVKTF